jgi:YD repeat-containing protein
MKFKLLWIFLILSACSTSFAQISGSRYFVPNPFPNSPNSAAFAKYGDYKVSYFTGVPDISIPLYTVQSGGLQIPITLSYHASGIRVSDVAGWAGLGWSVSSGGSVTRRVVGLEDENSSGYLAGNWKDPLTIDLNTDNNDILWASLVVQGNTDSRPDIFSYDFPGYSGKFFFEGSNGYKPALIPFSPISIVNTAYTVGGPSMPYPKIPNFTITDEHGNVSKFGYNNRETTMTTTPNVTKTVTTAWMLESMMSQDRKDTVTWSYTTQAVANPGLTAQYDVITDNVSGSGPHPYTNYYAPGAHNNSTTLSNIVENDVSQINFKNGKVVFQKDASIRQDVPTTNSIYGLANIKIYALNFSTKSYQLQKSIVFYKSYFNPSGNENQKRLRLDSIQVLDAGGSIMQHYRFTYNTSITMPAYDSFAKDYWDYYNGKTTSDALVPHMTYTASWAGGTNTYTIGSSVANNRDPDSSYMQACMLTSIAYPTGGHTDFTYQTNRYLDINNNLVLAGGLRITSIKSYDGINPTPIVKTYQYNSARFNSYLLNAYFTNTQLHRYWGLCQSDGNGHIINGQISGYENYNTVNSNPTNDLVPFDGSIVVYPSVSEFIGTPGANVGRTTYIFRDASDARQTSMSGAPLFESTFYARGQLLSKTDWLRKSDGSYQIVKKDSSSYTAFPKNYHENAGIVVDQKAWDEGPCPDPMHYYGGGEYSPNTFNQFVWQNYSIPSDDNYQTGSTTYLYDQTDPTKFTTSTVTNKFDNFKHQQVTRSYHTDSKGNINIATMKYPADYLNGNSTGNVILDSMLNRNMQAELIEKWDTVKNVSTSTSGVVSGQLNSYRLVSNLGGTEVMSDKVSRLRVAAPLTNFTASVVSSGALTSDSRYQQMISFDNYSFYNNLVQYTARNSTPVAIIWDYNNALPVAQVKNATNGNAAYTSFEARGMGGWNYSGVPVNDPTAPTGQNVYSLANGSVTTYPTDYSRAYLVSYWSNNGLATVYAGNYIGGTARRAANGWTYYEHLIPAGSAGSVTVSGTTSIDELAYYPQDAQITTYTYDPNGLTDLTDTKGVITGFDYDFFQRLKNIRDWNGNILKNYGYHNYDMTKTNDAISTPTLTRNNCPPGTNPTSTTFTVPAGKYSSSTKASANAEAQYDHDTYGQVYANKTCGCPVQMISFTLTNNTGATGLSANFSGPASYSFPFPASGSTTVQIPAGTYSLSLPPVAPFNSYHWKLGNVRAEIYAPSASFSNVIIGIGSTDSFLTVY